MINFRFWSIPVLITADSGPITDIQILQISKMLLIKISDPVNKFLPVDRSSRTGGKNLLLSVIMADVLAFSPGKSPAKGTVIISGIIHLVPVMKLDHLCLTGKCLLMSAQGSNHLLQEIRFRFRIIVQKQHIWGTCRMDPFIDGSAETVILRKLYHVYPWIFR